ncbi:MAG: hypothetical protein HYU88_10385 [Chloroflexi bacterium]|nr:hypothetical protein [Chloroflexota bacterium]MBI4507742.1 hypothetical protein [Chloroflexota bacterium]
MPSCTACRRLDSGAWSILRSSGGYADHPETRRWRGHRPALWQRHAEQVAEMARRGWRGHRSPLPESS